MREAAAASALSALLLDAGHACIYGSAMHDAMLDVLGKRDLVLAEDAEKDEDWYANIVWIDGASAC